MNSVDVSTAGLGFASVFDEAAPSSTAPIFGDNCAPFGGVLSAGAGAPFSLTFGALDLAPDLTVGTGAFVVAVVVATAFLTVGGVDFSAPDLTVGTVAFVVVAVEATAFLTVGGVDSVTFVLKVVAPAKVVAFVITDEFVTEDLVVTATAVALVAEMVVFAVNFVVATI
jgi:hypothetical protein